MKDQATGGRCRVNVFADRAKSAALFLDGFHDPQEVAQGSRQAIILGDNDHIALA